MVRFVCLAHNWSRQWHLPGCHYHPDVVDVHHAIAVEVVARIGRHPGRGHNLDVGHVLLAIAVINEAWSRRLLRQAGQLGLANTQRADAAIRNAGVFHAMGMLDGFLFGWMGRTEQALASQLAARLADKLGRRVHWQLVARAGLTTQQTLQLLRAEPPLPADVAVVVTGVNDVVDQVPSHRAVAAREALEETGLTVAIEGLLDVFYNPPGRGGASIFILYRARCLAGEPTAGDDADDARFFPLDALPDLAFASTRAAIELARASTDYSDFAE